MADPQFLILDVHERLVNTKFKKAGIPIFTIKNQDKLKMDI